MNTTIRTIIASALIILAGKGLYAQKTITISDRVGKNQSVWVSDAPLEKVTGTAEGATGAIRFDVNNPSTMSGSVSFKTSTMTSGNTMRDDALKSATWLDAAKYPTISFAIVSVSDVAKNGNTITGKVNGKFTMHGVTKPLTAPFTMKYVPESAATRSRAPGDLATISTSFTIALSDYNVVGSRGTIGSKVGNTIKLTVNLFGATGL